MNVRVPTRQCVSCRNRYDKDTLIRIVKREDGEIIIDKRQRMDGRGAYLCRRSDCVENARKRHCIDRALKARTNDALYERLKEVVESEA